jgi:TPR repeat protein
MAAHCFKLSTDPRCVHSEICWRQYPQDGGGISNRLTSVARYFNKFTDSGTADGQWTSGCSLRDGTGISRDSTLAAYYFKLAADQGYSEGQYHVATCLLMEIGLQRDTRAAIRDFVMSADGGSSFGRAVVG